MSITRRVLARAVPFLIVTALCILFVRVSTGKPSIVPPKSLDIGIHVPKSVQIINIDVENQGTADLVLTKFSGSCSCTVPIIKNLVIPSHGKGTVPVEVRFFPVEGPFTSIVYFATNDQSHPDIYVKLKGTIESVMSAYPEHISFLSVRAETLPLQEHSLIKLTTNKGEWSDLHVVSQADYLKGSLDPTATNGELALSVDVARSAPCGEIDSWVDVKGKLAGKEVSTRVIVAGSVLGKFTANPSCIFFTEPHNANEDIAIAISGITDLKNLTVGFVGDGIADQVEAAMPNANTLLVRRKKVAAATRIDGCILIADSKAGKLISIPVYGAALFDKS